MATELQQTLKRPSRRRGTPRLEEPAFKPPGDVSVTDEEVRDFESPEDQRQLEREAREAKLRRVLDIGNEVWSMISAAVSAKESSGVESRMREDLSYYYGSERIALQVHGIVDQAQADKAKDKNSDDERLTRSTISVNITRPKVNAAFARMSDMLLPVDDRNFDIEHTPVPQLANDVDPKALQAGPGGTVGSAEQIILKKTEVAKAAAAAMRSEIDDNLTECDYNAEARKMLFQAVCLGTGVQRGPVAAMRVEKAWIQKADGEWEMKIVENLVPETRWVDVFNFYPDPACNGIVKNARYIVEASEYNARMLRELRDQPGFITESIDRCLTSKPGSIRRQKSEAQIVPGSYQPKDFEMYEVFTVTCEMTKGRLDDLGVKGVGGWKKFKDQHGRTVKEPVPLREEDREDAIGACVVMCNGMPIKAYLNPLKHDHGYQVFNYEPVHGQVFGLGVSFLVRSPQRVLSTAWRMVMDNAALTVGGLVVIDKTCVEPADGEWDLYGGKVFYKTVGIEKGGEVDEAFRVYNMESHLDKLVKIIEMAIKFAEDETSLPSLMEGNQGAAPDTVGGMTLLMNSANVVLKVLAKRFDDSVTKPHILGYYDWHMLYTEKPEIKGDFNVQARGSSHLVVRDLARQSLIGFMQYSQVPHLAIFFKNGAYNALRKTAEANHIGPDDVLVSETEAPQVWQNYQKAMQQAAQAAAGAKSGADPQAAAQMERAKLDAEYADRREQRNHDMRLAMMKFAQERGLKLEDVRAAFAEKIMDQTHQKGMQTREIDIKEQTGSGI